MEYNNIPFCCKHCIHLEAWEYPDYGDEDRYFCTRKIKFPVIKQSCKRQKDWIPGRSNDK